MGRSRSSSGSALTGAVVAAAPPLAAALIGGLASRDAAEVYERLDKPSWAPPSSVFGPVWSALYASIGYAGWRMWRRRVGGATWALHGTQLALNAAWSPAFFGLRDKRVSLGVIAALDAALVAQLVTLVREDRIAAAALVPYLGWTAFATVLNASVSDPGTPR